MANKFVIAQGCFEDVRHLTSTGRWAKPGHPKVRRYNTEEDARQSAESETLAPVGGWRVLGWDFQDDDKEQK